MAKLQVKAGGTSRREYVFIPDSTSTTGAGKTGLAYNTSGLKAYYVRPSAVSVAITLVTRTVTGAFSSGGFVEVDATNMPGVYRFDIPDAVFASGVNKAVVMLSGATGMAPVPLEYQLSGGDPDVSVPDVNVAQINGATAGAAALDRSARSIVRGTVGSSSSTTSIVTSSLDPAAAVADQFKGRIVIFDRDTTTANLRGQATDITASTSGGVLTVSVLTDAPASGDTFVIV